MSRDPLLYLEDIIEACDKILLYTKDTSFDDLESESMLFDAVVRNIEIIGEAAKNVPDSIRQEVQEVPWKEIAAMRDILAHAYFGVDPEIVWDVVKTKVEPLNKTGSSLFCMGNKIESLLENE